MVLFKLSQVVARESMLTPLRFSRVVSKESSLINLMIALQQNLIYLDWNERVQ